MGRRKDGGIPTILYHGGTMMTGAPVNQNIINTFFTDPRIASGSYYTVNDT
jgi:hypothetical protein